MPGSRTLGRTGVALGVLAVLAVPAGIAVAQALASVTLLQGLYVGTPVSLGLGLLALLFVRRARIASARTLTGGGPVRLARLAAWAGLYVGVSAAIALGVYAVLVHAQ